ncbi:BNR-4 repeat-containing protein [Luteolibacter arcticus]|uniref:BNR-4 repeat-containing protein n=1 Tax=Luteolibacter arcticus TaxID=1581411 RepID=A0ABT3GBT5_9BACT|nr:BNR-4 repeat-containing protein [Luteolibacter arcticus]MCW1921089.1 BNR-4 repeat-containing protein [Luteolibacter arcticus]
MTFAARLLPLPFFTVLPMQAAIIGPYAVDADTVHLFHFDETAGTSVAANAVGGGRSGIAFDGTTLLNHATAPQPVSTAVLGAAGYSTPFGAAANISAANLGIGLDGNGSGGFQVGTASTCPDAVAHSSFTGSGGAFTIEALVKLPSITGSQREIACTDSAFAARGFQFRVSSSGQLEFNFIATAGAAATAAIPTTGTHAFSAANWYHLAVTHDGTTTRLYWTRVDASVSSANEIGSTTTETMTGSVTGPLVIGNEARLTGNATEGLLGLIDEVRISKVARGANGFIFEPLDLETDTDHDLLPDAWERLHAPTLGKLSGLDDANHDNDSGTDLAEYEAGSDPVDPDSTPSDIDADTLPDTVEVRYFGDLSQGPTGDPDGDGGITATELANRSAPNHRASNAADTDADSLPDAWEQAHFSSLSLNGGSDPDGDGFGNLQERIATTDPGDAGSRPTGTAVNLVPLDDGDHATSDFGYAGASAINTVAFVRSSLKTVGDQQFITWYGRHQHDAAADFNNTIWIGRRTLGSSQWEIFRHPTYTANNIGDGHDVISYGIDGEGYMHLSWGMHGDAFHYARSTTPVTGTGPIVLGPDGPMSGSENAVTYPQFLKLPDGDLLFLFREIASGNGETFITRYDTATDTWTPVHQNGGLQAPFIKGTWAPAYDYNAYLNMPQLGGPDGDDLILTWCWRYLPVNGSGAPGSPGGFSGYQTNNMLCFGRSTDAGLTWQRFDGSPYSLPISRDAESGVEATRAETIVTIPEGSSLINQASTCLDRAGNPVTATWWAPQTATGNFRRQYMVVFRHDNGTWQTRTVSNRTHNPTGTRYSETAVRDLGRPIVVNDDEDRIIVAYRDDSGDNGITIVHSLPKAQDPDRQVWIEFDLTRENLGNFEPIIDNELWDRDRQLHFLYQASEGEGYTPPANSADRMSVLEWDAATYFAHKPQPRVSFSSDRTEVSIAFMSEPSWTYRLWSSTDLDDWAFVETRDGTGEPLVFTWPAVEGETKRFWRVEFVEGGF